jgi:hypothetical protein
MTATVYNLRPFQSARDQARRAGVDPRQAIAEVREAQHKGAIGNYVAAKYRALAWRPSGPGGGSAA